MFIIDVVDVMDRYCFNCIGIIIRYFNMCNAVVLCIEFQLKGRKKGIKQKPLILATIFSQFLPAGSINFSACEDAGTIRGWEQNKGRVNITWQQRSACSLEC